MKALDFQIEEFHISKPIGHFPKGFDFVIGSFQWLSRKVVEILAKLRLRPTRHDLA
uniref:Uncharacterized protein n=1 Tax=Candidatus Kentrum sp. TC TaxID=2126339 RepID=A0A450ZB32_9GAMM|nr:MAG: hypothetical protein BECKTC1821D_GA0114238_11284 [Candidatus Kentron sp. TC]VFK62562.1 MAG: hypothetical protein BECKTC1821F_GA0114240_10765 [Candidatus Kentron sp. TC]